MSQINPNPSIAEDSLKAPLVEPLCPVFGECGGCAYQHLPYEEELRIKTDFIQKLFLEDLGIGPDVFDPVEASPQPYHYRNRLDVAARRTKAGEFFMGFTPEGRRRIIPIESCAIAMKEISDFLPALAPLAKTRMEPDYRIANLVVRSGAGRKVHWGGICRRSLQMKEEDFLWADILGKRIFYSLDTFFQGNLFILPKMMQKLESWAQWNRDTLFLDLYAGVGLFGLFFADQVGKVLLVEESNTSIRMARHNTQQLKVGNVEIIEKKVEDVLHQLTSEKDYSRHIAMIDPPRKGLSERVAKTLAEDRGLETLFYLSCNPLTLIKDLKVFLSEGWTIEKIAPFDFFPKTKHLEVLSWLRPPA